jgi:hypothetical protein
MVDSFVSRVSAQIPWTAIRNDEFGRSLTPGYRDDGTRRYYPGPERPHPRPWPSPPLERFPRRDEYYPRDPYARDRRERTLEYRPPYRDERRRYDSPYPEEYGYPRHDEEPRRLERHLRPDQEPIFETVRPRVERPPEEPPRNPDPHVSTDDIVLIVREQWKRDPPIGFFCAPFPVIKDPWD